jgi:hypothetical protein
VLAEADDGGRPAARDANVKLAQDVAQLEGLLQVSLLIAVNGLRGRRRGRNGRAYSEFFQVALLIAVNCLWGRRRGRDGRAYSEFFQVSFLIAVNGLRGWRVGGVSRLRDSSRYPSR